MASYGNTVSLIIATTLVGGCSGSTTNTVDNEMLFEPCVGSTALECGVFEVPLIHGTTDNRRISIDVARLPGTGEGPHEPLLLNLGGPGSGTETLGEVAESGLLESLRERYDIIGFDQRGVAKPLRVDCDHLGDVEAISYPRNQSDVQTLFDDATFLADACSAEYGDQLQWVGSNSVVQDMDVLRTQLNAPKLNIISSSFGTRITALYLQRFPDTSGRIIMDAPLRSNGALDAIVTGSAIAHQENFEQILDACGSILSGCDRATVEAEFLDRVKNLLDEGDQDTFGAFFNLLTIAVQDSELGEVLAPLLIDYAFSGDPTDMFALIQDFGLAEDADAGSDMGEDDIINERITLERAVLCADDAVRPDVDQLVSSLNSLNGTSNLFAESLLLRALSCAGWPEALGPIDDIRTTEAPTALVIGGSGDVLTPLAWVVEMAGAIGGVFLSSDHPGHGTLFTRENECVDSITVNFLLNGTLPSEGTVCE